MEISLVLLESKGFGGSIISSLRSSNKEKKRKKNKLGDWLYPNSLVPVHKEAPRPEYKINGKKTALVEIRKDV
jgi:hypothetical protein